MHMQIIFFMYARKNYAGCGGGWHMAATIVMICASGVCCADSVKGVCRQICWDDAGSAGAETDESDNLLAKY